MIKNDKRSCFKEIDLCTEREHNWIRNPFVENANAPQEFTSLESKQFIDLSSDLTLKSIYNLNSLTSFWVKGEPEFPLVGSKALIVAVPFATSYLCKAGSSAVAVIKSKYRNKIDIERDMCVAISNIAPRFNKTCIEQQAHCSVLRVYESLQQGQTVYQLVYKKILQRFLCS